MPRSKQFNEEEVLLKATNLFWKKGYSATSIQDLVSELGINRASLYDTFGGKKELFERTFNGYRMGSASSAKEKLYSSNSVKESFKNFFYASVNELIKDKEAKGCYVANSIAEYVPENESLNEPLKKNRKFYEDLFSKRINEGIYSGELSKNKDSKAISRYLFAFNNGLALTSKINRNKKQLQEIVDSALMILE